MSKAIISARSLVKTYGNEDGPKVDVLKGVNLDVGRGESVAIMGASGSGKSTLLHLLGGLDSPTKGEILVKGRGLSELSEEGRCELRNTHLGFIYQFHHLLGEFTALENVAMPLLISRANISAAEKRARYLLNRVGLANRVHHLPSELSGGERQRVAIARALAANPSILLADEPTGNLDRSSAMDFINLVFELRDEFDTSLILVTHDQEISKKLQKQYKLVEGCLESA